MERAKVGMISARLATMGHVRQKVPAHRYFFKLYALDRKLKLKAGTIKAELERAMKGHILAEAEVVGRFQH